MADFSYTSDQDILLALAEGRHPLTGESLPENPLLNDPRIVRALFHAADLLVHSDDVQPCIDEPDLAHAPWGALIGEGQAAAHIHESSSDAKGWNSHVDHLLTQAFDARIDLDEIAKWLECTKEVLTSRLQELGKI